MLILDIINPQRACAKDYGACPVRLCVSVCVCVCPRELIYGLALVEV